MMFFAIYHKDTGLGVGTSGPDIEWANAEAARRGEDFAALVTDRLIDNMSEKVDVTADPPVLIAFRAEKSQNELRIDVNRERTRRLVAGAVFDGIRLTGSDDDIRNLTNLALGAQLRLMTGDTTLTTFRDGDNADHQLTPLQMLELWQQSSAYVSALYQASWALKAMEVIPEEFADDQHWP